MVNPFALIDLEIAAQRSLSKAMRPSADKLGAAVRAAIKCKSEAKLNAALRAYDPSAGLRGNQPLYEQLALSAAIYGASRVESPRDTLFAQGRGHKPVLKAVDNLLASCSMSAKEHMKRICTEVLAKGAPKPKRSTVTKSALCLCCPPESPSTRDHITKGTVWLPHDADLDAYADALNEATLGGHRIMTTVYANLTTTRMASYGFLTQAREKGIKTYQVSAELDARTCPVCVYMNGKSFSVEPALTHLDAVLRETNPEALKTLAPWHGQDRASLERLYTYTPEELVRQRMMTPPFHPGCRCILVRTGSVESTIAPSTPAEADALIQPTGWLPTLMQWLQTDPDGDDEATNT